MVPTFGLFEFEAPRKAFVSSEDLERSGYLSEVVLQSTEFGAGSFGDSFARKAEVDGASLFNPF